MTPRTEAGRALLSWIDPDDGKTGVRAILAIEQEAAEAERARTLAPVLAALTSEDEIAHGEAWNENHGHGFGLGVCAYCDDQWPCRTQRGIDRLLAILDPRSDKEPT